MFTEEMAVALLRQKWEEFGRLPKKEDFSPVEIAQIKSRLGPWPRALEKAGLKEPAAPQSRTARKRKEKSRRQRKAAIKKL